jgi:hypothetical protein
MSGVITGAVVGSELLRALVAGRKPTVPARSLAITTAGVLAAVGLSNRNTQLTLELGRRLERARAGPRDGQVVRFPQHARPMR